MHISYFQYRGEGTNWIPIDLNANILARNIYFLQIKEEEKKQYLMLHFEKKGKPETLHCLWRGYFPRCSLKIHDFKIHPKKHLEKINQIYLLLPLRSKIKKIESKHQHILNYQPIREAQFLISFKLCAKTFAYPERTLFSHCVSKLYSRDYKHNRVFWYVRQWGTNGVVGCVGKWPGVHVMIHLWVRKTQYNRDSVKM